MGNVEAQNESSAHGRLRSLALCKCATASDVCSDTRSQLPRLSSVELIAAALRELQAFVRYQIGTTQAAITHCPLLLQHPQPLQDYQALLYKALKLTPFYDHNLNLQVRKQSRGCLCVSQWRSESE